jgi:quinol monooxygenase YgiN
VSQIAIIVEFDIDPAQFMAFNERIRAHAKRTLAVEKECRQFDVLVPKEGQNRIVLYEIYDSEAAVKAHIESDRYAEYQRSVKDMIKDRRVKICLRD